MAEVEADRKEKIEEAHQLILTIIPKLMKHRQSEHEDIEQRLGRMKIFVKVLRGLTYFTAFFAFLGAFYFSQYVAILIPYSLICFTFISFSETMWLHTLDDRIAKAAERANPTVPDQVLRFLEVPEGVNRLKAIFAEPSDEMEYHQKYIHMLVDLGNTCGWLEGRIKDLQDFKDTMVGAADDAYSYAPIKFDAEFISGWKKTYEELQKEVKEHFGKDLDNFHHKTVENPTYFLTRFRSFSQSDVGQKLNNFLR
ncbi:MAG: hypothetical protein K940chlam7_00629 [Chlamydiae bacterium]|nr:hypothetical protein [Chlamydiota bacterium]